MDVHIMVRARTQDGCSIVEWAAGWPNPRGHGPRAYIDRWTGIVFRRLLTPEELDAAQAAVARDVHRMFRVTMRYITNDLLGRNGPEPIRRADDSACPALTPEQEAIALRLMAEEREWCDREAALASASL